MLPPDFFIACMIYHSTIVKSRLLKFIFLGMVFFPVTSHADIFTTLDKKPLDELWLNAGFYSYHFEKDKHLEDNNVGIGLEYRYSTVNSISAGRFHNSDRYMSDYAAWLWQPVAADNVHLGVLLALIDGYPKISNGGWFAIVLPVASIEYKNFSLSLTAVPTYKDMLHGSISLQLRVKIY